MEDQDTKILSLQQRIQQQLLKHEQKKEESQIKELLEGERSKVINIQRLIE